MGERATIDGIVKRVVRFLRAGVGPRIIGLLRDRQMFSRTDRVGIGRMERAEAVRLGMCDDEVADGV